MAFSFLDETNIFDRYKDAKRHTDSLTTPFPEFERIARNRPHPSIDPAYPKTTDGTTASIIRKTPRRVIQQLPTGKVITDDGGWLGIVADFVYNKKILPFANEEYDLIQKTWAVVENGLSFGFCATYTPFLNHNGTFCPDVTAIYWGDVAIQPGKKSFRAAKYKFMRSWWQPEDIDALIDKETKLMASAKKRKDKYDSTWDLVALKKIKKSATAKDQQATTPVERERQTTVNTGIELITGFQDGVGAKFFTFNPKEEIIVRTKINKDPRGKPPIDAMYGDMDGSNPLGRGLIELVGGLQNLIDSDMQMYQFNRALMLAPPIVIGGSTPKSNVKFVPNAIIKKTSPEDTIVPLEIDTTAVANYPALYGLQKSQLLNLVASPDTSISADIGNVGFSKTDAGVKQTAATISVDDNYVRKMFEAWFQEWSETAINLYFAERSGIDELQLDKLTAMKLRELPGFDQSLLSDDNQIRIDYDTETPILKFRVDPSTTSVKDTAAQVQDATSLLDIVMKYPMLNANFGGPIDVDVLARRIVVNSGIDDPEMVAPEPTAAQLQAKEEAKNSTSPFSPMFDKPSIRINYPDLPVPAQVQLLGNAGIKVSPEDVLQGPVVDPNMRGVTAPVQAPNELMPGGGAPIQPQPGQAPMNSPQMPQPQVAQSPPPQAQPQQFPQVQQQQQNPHDQLIIAQLQQLGFSQDQIAQAIQMLNAGYNEQDVIQMLRGGQ